MMGMGGSAALRLEIDPVIDSADEIALRVQQELPTHSGLARAANGVAAAAREAKLVARSLRRPWGLHRLPVIFLAAALVILAVWSYFHFFHVSRLTIALPDRDATYFHQRLSLKKRIQFREVRTEGSRQNLALLTSGEVDLAFIQGGIEFPRDLPRLEIPSEEVALLFVRDRITHPRHIRKLLTSVAGQGSHTVIQSFERIWAPTTPIEYLHTWRVLTENPSYVIPDDVDAVFAIKDLGTEPVEQAARVLAAAGFRLVSPTLGARSLTMPYLRSYTLPAGFLLADPPVPATDVPTYSVITYLVARHDLTPRLLAASAHLIDADDNSLDQIGFEPTVSETSELLQGVEAFLGILVYIGLAFLALLGIEITTYRRRFNELNTLISLISMHQSNKDVLGLTDVRQRNEHLLYLGLCSDLLGIISVITGYYSQENASLLYNKLLEIIHHRSSGLKLNIQLKIMHASIELQETVRQAGHGGAGAEPNATPTDNLPTSDAGGEGPAGNRGFGLDCPPSHQLE